MGSIKYKDQAYKVLGSPLNKEAIAPSFELTAPDLQPVTIESFSNTAKIILTLPTIDDESINHLLHALELFSKQQPEIACIVITNDTPFALALKQEKLKNIHFLFNNGFTNFQKDYGVAIDAGPLKGLLAKSAYLLDNKDSVQFNEFIENIDYNPDTDKLFKEAVSLLG